MIKVKTTNDVPVGKHFAVLIYGKTSVYHEESGVWAPGHGYPAYTEEVNNFEHYVTTDQKDWEDFIQVCELDNRRQYSKIKPYVALVVEKKAVITNKVDIK